MKIRKELIGSKITTANGARVIIEDTPECIKLCKLLKLDVFEKKVKKDVEPK